MTPAAIVSRLWNFCNGLRDDGMSSPPSYRFGRTGGVYVEPLIYLLFLKMADERTKPQYVFSSVIKWESHKRRGKSASFYQRRLLCLLRTGTRPSC